MKNNFKDFWTHDMRQFYDDSWGQENFNHEIVQSSMPVEPEKWKICSADQFYNKNKYKREPFCVNCKERGHMRYDCLKQQILKCEICGLTGHSFYRCPNALCTTCRSATQNHTSSCYNCRRFQFTQCGLCKTLGHEMKHCPDLWRRYHQTTTYNKILKQSKMSSKNHSTLWCSNCANQGHPADKCRYPCGERILSTTEVFSYEDVYDNDFKLNQSSIAPKINDFKLNQSCIAPKTNDFKLNQSCIAPKIKPPKRKKVRKTREEQVEKFQIILEKLKKDCDKSDSNSLALIKQYQYDIKNNKVGKKFRRKVNKLRNKIKFS